MAFPSFFPTSTASASLTLVFTVLHSFFTGGSNVKYYLATSPSGVYGLKDITSSMSFTHYDYLTTDGIGSAVADFAAYSGDKYWVCVSVDEVFGCSSQEYRIGDTSPSVGDVLLATIPAFLAASLFGVIVVCTVIPAVFALLWVTNKIAYKLQSRKRAARLENEKANAAAPPDYLLVEAGPAEGSSEKSSLLPADPFV
ncbi:hypothetical protein J8273_3809 [Carpediemonas membranifera]|uniref:Uncharacterized protein n=1 Tax=Carpediemonas membranifera TaxID=201153 RepID=A0A8J6ATZ0_9EUKA|nr:hypothetical protein J8273_3809 [Carpediemonas membranifera]|eukprot:KAG9394561.1 hypothetical protein J8273_3809 [Carpediemonas membranifera]